MTRKPAAPRVVWELPGMIEERSTEELFQVIPAFNTLEQRDELWITGPNSRCDQCRQLFASLGVVPLDDAEAIEEFFHKYYRVTFHAASGPFRSHPVQRKACSRACAEQLASVAPKLNKKDKTFLTAKPTDGPGMHGEWIWTFPDMPDNPPVDERAGKWLLFLRPDEIDDAWERVREAVRAGELGGAAKAATHPSGHWGRYLICVYTDDYTDVADVRRVLQMLRRLGFTWDIEYKTDEATLKGIYSRPGQRASLYRSKELEEQPLSLI